MKDLSTKYMGLQLSSPIIAGSSGLTNSIENIVELDRLGVGAIVLKSLFEEEIDIEIERSKHDMQRIAPMYPEIFDYFSYDTVEDSVTKYLSLIEEAKSKVKVPIIASVNCISAHEWHSFAKRFEQAGADALELNVFIMPSDFDRTAEDIEKTHFDILKAVKEQVSIPVSLKISHYFANLAQFIKSLSESGADGIVLFNRFYSPDFNVDSMRVVPASIYSTADSYHNTLRWIALLSGKVQCDLSASTGVHNGITAVKMLLAGATTVQITSALYKTGFNRVQFINEEISKWMEEKEFDSIDDFRGKLSQFNSMNPTAYERTQFMRHFSNKFE
jgi:dihydroorotate dehydrogenase (fumarate)